MSKKINPLQQLEITPETAESTSEKPTEQKKSDWQPIKTAPTDGTPVLLRDDAYAGPDWVFIGIYRVSFTSDDYFEIKVGINTKDKLVSDGVNVPSKQFTPTLWKSI